MHLSRYARSAAAETCMCLYSVPQNAFAGRLTLLQAGMGLGCFTALGSQDVGTVAGLFCNVA